MLPLFIIGRVITIAATELRFRRVAALTQFLMLIMSLRRRQLVGRVLIILLHVTRVVGRFTDLLFRALMGTTELISVMTLARRLRRWLTVSVLLRLVPVIQRGMVRLANLVVFLRPFRTRRLIPARPRRSALKALSGTSTRTVVPIRRTITAAPLAPNGTPLNSSASALRARHFPRMAICELASMMHLTKSAPRIRRISPVISTRRRYVLVVIVARTVASQALLTLVME